MGNREHRWRCAWSLVTLKDGARPLDGVAHPDARRLRVRPEFEVLATIVVTDAVPVVHGFIVQQIPAKQVLRHEYVLEHIRPACGPRMTRCTHHDIAGFVPSSATLPISVRLFRLVSAATACLRLQLLELTAPAKTSRSARGTPKVSTRWAKDAKALLAPSMPHKETVTSRCNWDEGAGCRRSLNLLSVEAFRARLAPAEADEEPGLSASAWDRGTPAGT